MTRALSAILLALTFGCAQLGIEQPQTLSEKLAYGYTTLASVRVSTASALDSKLITRDDAIHVQTLADAARQGLDAGRTVAASDPSTAAGKIALATGILSQLQTYLSSRGVK